MHLSHEEQDKYRDFIRTVDADFAKRGVATCRANISQAEERMQTARAIIASSASPHRRREAEATLESSQDQKDRNQFVLDLYEERLSQLQQDHNRASDTKRATRGRKPKTEAEIISVNIKRLRRNCGWSQDELDKKSGIAKRVIVRHEQGQKPTPKNLKIYADTFGVTVEELLRDSL